jgi:hypothetical protein
VAYTVPSTTVESPSSYTLPTSGRDLVLTGSAVTDGTGNAFNNTITGNDAANQLSGLGGMDNLSGGAGNDILSGGSGADFLSGGTGNDMIDGGADNDWVDGGDGIDTASYASATSAVNVSLNLTDGQETGGAGRDTLVSIENLTGSAFGDTLTGNDSDNVFSSGDGNDTLTSGRGADILDGGTGSDTANYWGFWLGLPLASPRTAPNWLRPSTARLSSRSRI